MYCILFQALSILFRFAKQQSWEIPGLSLVEEEKQLHLRWKDEANMKMKMLEEERMFGMVIAKYPKQLIAFFLPDDHLKHKAKVVLNKLKHLDGSVDWVFAGRRWLVNHKGDEILQNLSQKFKDVAQHNGLAISWTSFQKTGLYQNYSKNPVLSEMITRFIKQLLRTKSGE